jgi:hypothetical protein
MPYITDHLQKFTDLEHHLSHQDQLRRKANGGNSVLFSYDPLEEQLYTQKAIELYNEKATFIDISKLFVQFINEDGIDDFLEYYQDFKNTSHKIFKSDDPATDLFDMIISAIEDACAKDTIPFLIRTGCLYGTGIENVNIMEHKKVMGLPHPLVIFYPSRHDEDNIYFLNFKLASKYRCILVK